MKVKELIDELKKFDDDCEVFFNDDSYTAAPVGKVASTNFMEYDHLHGVKPNSVMLDWED